MKTFSPGEDTFIKLCLFILTSVAAAFALFWLRPVMIPFILALFFSLMLTPLIDAQKKYLKFPKILALITTLALGILILVVFWLVITSSISQIAQNVAQYQQKIELFLNKIIAMIHLEKFGINIKQLTAPFLKNMGENAGVMIRTVINAILGIFSQGFLVLIFLVFLLLGKAKSAKTTNRDWLEGERRIKRYIGTKFLTSASTGVLVGIILHILQVDMATLFGLFAFILNFIPSIGSIIATLLPLPVVLASPDLSVTSATLAIVIPGTIQFIIGNILEPQVIGDLLDLHPISVLMALIFWGMIWGIVGMFLAVPLTVIMQIIFSRIELTAPIAGLLAGRLEKD
ncbi:MAG: AI-2E family transporter [Candidatus Omnitrophica bacterium]|nr:AI-2E family transporter [Candidatus Omnitrophota bacterium]